MVSEFESSIDINKNKWKKNAK